MAALQPLVEGLPIANRSFAEVMSSAGPKASTTNLLYTRPDSCLDPAAAQIGKHKGHPAIAFSKPHVQQISSSFKWVLIGKFAKGYNKDQPNLGRPNVEELKKYFDSLDFRGSYQIGLLDNRHLLIQFKLQEDFLHMYSRAVWRIKGISMRILKWSPAFHVDRELPVAPVWVGFPRLPIQYFETKTVFAIASLIGSPLRTDSATVTLKRPSIARVQVEIDLLKDRPSQIWISVEGEHGFWQPVEYERVPEYCPHCWHIGHSEFNCHVRCPDLKNSRQKIVVQNDVVQNSTPMPSQAADLVEKPLIAHSAAVQVSPSASVSLISVPVVDQNVSIPAAITKHQLSASVVPLGSAPVDHLISIAVPNIVDHVPVVSTLEHPMVEGLANAPVAAAVHSVAQPIIAAQTDSAVVAFQKTQHTVPVAAAFKSVLSAFKEQEIPVAPVVSNAEIEHADVVSPAVGNGTAVVVEVIPSSEEDQAYVVRDSNKFSVMENLNESMQHEQLSPDANQDGPVFHPLDYPQQPFVDNSVIVAAVLPEDPIVTHDEALDYPVKEVDAHSSIPMGPNASASSQRELIVLLPPIVPNSSHESPANINSEPKHTEEGAHATQALEQTLPSQLNVDAASWYPRQSNDSQLQPSFSNIAVSPVHPFNEYNGSEWETDNGSDGEEGTDKDSEEDFWDSQTVRDDTYLEKRKKRHDRRERDVVLFRGRGRPLGSRNRTYFDIARTMSTRSRILD